MSEQTVTHILQGGVIAATLALGAVAALQDWIREWVKGPKLRIVLAPWTDAHYRRIRVSNESGRGPARDVEAVALRLTREQDGAEVSKGFHLPVNLNWSEETSHKRALPTLHRGMYWDCDVIHLDGIGKKVERCALAAKVQTPRGIPPGQYVLTIRVAASNHKAVDARFRLIFTDQEFENREEASQKGCILEPC